MLSALLLGLLAIGATAREPEPPVRLWLDRKDEGYWRGDRVKVFLKTREDRYLLVFHVDPDKRLRVLFPLDPGDDNYVKGRKTYKVTSRGGREGFVADVAGTGTLFVAASSAPFKFDAFVRNEFWDYNTLNATPIEGDVEQALLDLAQRMAGGRFDYDILAYHAYADASEIAPGTDLAYEVEPTLNGCLGCAPVNTVAVGPGGPVYCSSSLYDPLCYDPSYWSPGYVPPDYWNVGWGWYGGYYGASYGAYNVGFSVGYYGGNYGGGYAYMPVSPYQPKPWDRQWSGESPSYHPRVATENVNTVVGPLPSTGRILKADPRRSWGGTAPVAVPAAPAPPVPSQPQGQSGGTPTYTSPKGREQQGPSKPAQPAPGGQRSWSDGKAGQGGQKASPQPSAGAGGGSTTKSSQPTQPSHPTSGGGGRRRG